jgi:hypothetical protein
LRSVSSFLVLIANPASFDHIRGMLGPMNPRHEKFALAIASGSRYGDAYLAAGYRCKPRSAEVAGRRLAIERETVAARILELREQVAQKSVDRIVETTVGPPAPPIDRGYIRDSLRFIAEAGMGRAKGEDGKPIKLPNPSAAIRALELLAKHVGSFFDPEPEPVGSAFRHLSDEELNGRMRDFFISNGVDPATAERLVQGGSDGFSRMAE